MAGGIKPLLFFTWRLVWFKKIHMSVSLTGWACDGSFYVSTGLGHRGAQTAGYKLFLGVFAWRCSKRLAFELWTEERRRPSPVWVGLIKSTESPIEQNGGGRLHSHSTWSFGSGLQSFAFSSSGLGLQTQPRIYTVSSLAVSLWITPSAFWVPLALFIWRKLTNTPSLTALKESLCKSKTNTK